MPRFGSTSLARLCTPRHFRSRLTTNRQSELDKTISVKRVFGCFGGVASEVNVDHHTLHDLRHLRGCVQSLDTPDTAKGRSIQNSETRAGRLLTIKQ